MLSQTILQVEDLTRQLAEEGKQPLWQKFSRTQLEKTHFKGLAFETSLILHIECTISLAGPVGECWPLVDTHTASS